MVSWNNQSAPDFYQSNGDYQRVQILSRLIGQTTGFDLPALAEVSQIAAVTDILAVTFLPLLSRFTDQLSPGQGEALSPMLAELTRWTEDRQAQRVDLDGDGLYDDAGPAIMDELIIELKRALEARLGVDLGSLNLPAADGSAYFDTTTSRMRLLLNRALEAGNDPSRVDETMLQCGDGTFDDCRTLIIDALTQTRQNLADAFGTNNPASWQGTAVTLGFMPLGVNNDIPWHWQNRPTFQQLATVH